MDYANLGGYPDVQDILDVMHARGQCPNFITYNILLDGLCRSRHLEEAVELFLKIIGKGIRPNVGACNILINGLCKGGRLKTAQQFVWHIHNNGYQLNVLTYNAMIAGFCTKEGLFNEAMALLPEMDKNSCFLDIVTYKILIRALLEKNENHKAGKLLCEMISKRVMKQ